MTDVQSVNDPVLAMFLAERDAPCPDCGYNVRGCTAARCPECGWTLALQLSGHQRSRAWWMASVYGLSLTTLLSCVLLLMTMPMLASVLNDPRIAQLVSAGVQPSNMLPNWSSIVFLTICSAVSGGALSLVIALRRRFVTWGRLEQSAVTAASLISPLLLFGAVYLYA